MNTGVVVTSAVERTQRHLPADLIADYNEIAEALPPFTVGVADMGFSTYSSDMRQAGDEVMARYATSLQAIAESFFAMVGELLGGKQTELEPLVQMLEDTASVLPATAGGLLTPVTLRSLVERLNGAFGPGTGGGRKLKVKVNLDVLPVLQSAAFGAAGAAKTQKSESGGGR